MCGCVLHISTERRPSLKLRTVSSRVSTGGGGEGGTVGMIDMVVVLFMPVIIVHTHRPAI